MLRDQVAPRHNRAPGCHGFPKYRRQVLPVCPYASQHPGHLPRHVRLPHQQLQRVLLLSIQRCNLRYDPLNVWEPVAHATSMARAAITAL